MHMIDAALRSELARPKRGLYCFMVERHRELESECREVLGELSTGDPDARRIGWPDFDAALRDHMAAEDELVLPAYQRSEPEEAVELRNEHARIRALLDSVDDDIQLGATQTDSARQLIALLHAHAEREAASLYRWAERNLSLVIRRQWIIRLSHWLRRHSLRHGRYRR